jgi:hypothetical protein
MSPKDDKDVFDVSKPGETPAEPTGKPVIVRREGIIKQDPMVKEAEEEKPKEDENIEPKRVGATVKPPGGQDESKPPEAKESVAEKIEVKTKTEEEKPQTEDDAGNAEAEVNAIASQAKTKKELIHQTEEDQKRAQIRQNLIASKKYFLPIGEAKRRRSFVKLVILLIFLALLGTGYIMALNSGALEDTVNFINEAL